MPITFTVADDLVAALRARSESEGRPIEAVLTDLVRRGLAEQDAAASAPTPGYTTGLLPKRPGEPPLTHAFVRLMQEELEREDDLRAAGHSPADSYDDEITSEEQMRRLEERIPELAAPAFARASADALAAGSPVLVQEADALVEVSPDGTRRVLQPLPPPVPVPPRRPADVG